ncbi:dephospho-CoA kinase [uncultured Desulfobacter sp.]|jgi:dephospho-CoA kinase|uniref:dephospho-CoA kinase n=1 Tax=uncultured Desulfobacter sp. TaxID=240139 RepID=UPI0029C7FC78|nr:dephospho-CoA kinase [uncultured Desulfobacter sp.]
MMLKIGVTGSAGSGKSLVCEGFRRIGLVTLDCDEIARQVVEPGQAGYDLVVKAFGSEVVAPDRTLDRPALRRMIVTTKGSREKLESILHPIIISETVRLMEDAVHSKQKSCAVEVPLLFELGMENLFDVVVVVTASDSTLVDRISRRDGVNRESAQKLLAIQMPQSEKVQKADYVIENRGEPEAVFKSVDGLYQKLVNHRLTKK